MEGVLTGVGVVMGEGGWGSTGLRVRRGVWVLMVVGVGRGF